MADKLIPTSPTELPANQVDNYYFNLNRILNDGELLFSGTSLEDIPDRPHAQLTDIDAADNTDTDVTFDKHVSNALMKESKDHRDATSAHGATGDIVGNEDFATALVAGVVLEAVTQADAVSSTVSVDSADAGATYTSAEQTLINELKADVNTLTTDLNNAIVVINALIDKLQTAGVMA